MESAINPDPERPQPGQKGLANGEAAIVLRQASPTHLLVRTVGGERTICDDEWSAS
jgi:hypothetical protein